MAVREVELAGGKIMRVGHCTECDGDYDIDKDYEGRGYSFDDECGKCTYILQYRRFREEGGTGDMP